MKSISSRFSTRLLALGALAALMAPASVMAKHSSKMSGSAGGASTRTAKPARKAKKTQVTGTVLSMTDDSLTIKPSRKSNGASKTISVPAGTSVMVGREKSSLSSLQAGEKVTVRMNAEGTVTSIQAAQMKGAKKS